MRILLDECVNPRLKQAFVGHYVVTASDVEWRQLPDNLLLRATNGRFDALVTIDRGFEYEHNLTQLTFGIVIVHVEKNLINYYRPLFEALLAAVERIRPGEVIHVVP